MVGGRQPLHDRLDLASKPTAVRWARLHAKDLLGTWEVPESVAEPAFLIVSELVTNAVLHAGQSRDYGGSRPEAPRCSLNFWLTRRGLTVAVYDQERTPPVRREASEDADGGRGLALVEALSNRWGYTYPSSDSGKLVWARLPLPSASGLGGWCERQEAAPPVGLGSLGISTSWAALADLRR
jgi:anti-sigma regulatory factor (Ser/Thr protein kinase)